MSAESDEDCEMAYILDGDDDDDDDDDDYIPGKKEYDSDPDYGKKRKKPSSRSKYVPGKRNRTDFDENKKDENKKAKKSENLDDDEDKSESLEVPTKGGDKNSSISEDSEKISDIPEKDIPEKKSPGRPRKTLTSPTKSKSTKSPKTKSPRVKKPRKQKSSCSDDADESTSASRRRSSRSSQTRSISYADADVSEEDMFEDEDLIEAFRRSKEDVKAATKKKQHVDDLWLKFKTDVNEKETKEEEESTDDVTSTPITTEEDSTSAPTPTEPKNEKENKSELKSENKKQPVEHNEVPEVSETKVSETKLLPVEIKKKEMDSSSSDSSKKDDKIESSGNSIEKTKTCSPSKEIDRIEKSEALSTDKPEKDVECSAKQTSSQQQQQQQPKNEQPKNEQIAQPNTEPTAQSDIPVIKAGLVTDEKLTESKPSYTLPEREVVVIEEKPLLPAGSRNSPTQESKEAKSDGESFLMKANPIRSAGINKFLSSGVKKTGGLSSVLNTIEKKKKLSVLDKTKCDWDNYKSEADIEEELRGNRHSGYLDRQEFLQRVDVKQWENEREMRLYTNRK